LTQAALQNGAEVTVASRSVGEEIENTFGSEYTAKVLASVVDVADPNSLMGFFANYEQSGTTIDVVVNCTFPRTERYGVPFEDVEYEAFCENVNLHLGSAFLVCQKAAAYFSKCDSGNIINFSSIYGVMAPRFEIYEGTEMTKEVEYIMTKSAIVHFTKYLAKYLKGKNIRVNCISPGGIYNNEPEQFVENYHKHCLNKGMLENSDIAGTLLFLASDLSKHVNGQNIVVDDGFSL
jgi:NAD(P)-dependent dehydrogenase (short-subunit alcohol dehydrogenase family)